MKSYQNKTDLVVTSFRVQAYFDVFLLPLSNKTFFPVITLNLNKI